MPFSVNQGEGKLGVVELGGASSAEGRGAPSREQFRVKSFENLRENFDYFCLKGQLDGQECLFKIDTGSDVTVLRKDLLRADRRSIPIAGCKLHYPTGEIVPIDCKAIVHLEVGKFSLDFPVYLAEIKDDCILGADFLGKVGLGKIFITAFEEKEEGDQGNFICSRIGNYSDRFPHFLKEFYERHSQALDKCQKVGFANLLEEFQNVFSEDIVAGNCSVVEHSIEVKDSSPIKQSPRRIPLQMRGEVEGILREMKEQGVIEESHSPWVSPAVLVKKKRRFD